MRLPALIAAIAVTALTGCAPVVSRSAIEQVHVSLYPAEAEFAQNEQMELELRLWNEGRTARRLIATLDWRSSNVQLSIVGPNGAVLKRSGREPDDFPTDQITVPPGSFVSRKLILSDSLSSSRTFFFPTTGVYTARATITVCNITDHLCRDLTSEYVKIRIRPN